MKYNAIALISILLASIIPTNASNYSTAIIEFDGIDSKHGIDMLSKYDLTPIHELKYTFNGYIAKIRTDQIERLKQESIIKNIYNDKPIKIVRNIQKNLELIGIRDSIKYDGFNVTGKGVTVALIDTGVDYTHNDLQGFGSDKKVIAGYDFLNKDDDPKDDDGHGTMVAGIIAADGILRGVAPDAKIIAYKIASGDRYVSTSEMIRAMEMAADAQADILNISIGLDHINEEIDKAVNNLVEKGLVVVVAAGNDGESGLKSIKSPGSALKAITVGATLNDVNEPLFAMLKVVDSKEIFNPIPMADSVSTTQPIRGRLVFANYATEDDVKDLDLKGAIVLAERGGPVKIINGQEQRELVYFSDKEYNVARKGAAAIIVYNNEPGIFRGKLLHQNNKEGYKPSIPAVSLSQEEGLLLRKLLEERRELVVELRVYSDPNIIADFSSKGPVSPFYIKPDLVSPGVMINSTFINNSYNVSTGTSFAAPHVSGAAALLLQLHPDLKPEEVASLLITTADPLLDPYGNPYSFDVAGAGRLNVSRAIATNIIALPYHAILYVSPTTNGSKVINLRSIDGEMDEIKAYVKLYSNDNLDIKLDINDKSNYKELIVTASSSNITDNRYEGRIYIEAGDQHLTIPLIIYTSRVGVNAINEDGKIRIDIEFGDWEAAKIKIINPENNFKRVWTLTPTNNMLDIKASEIGEYWIDVSVISGNKINNGFATLYVNNISNDSSIIYLESIIPFKELLIIFGFISIISITVLIIKKRYRKEKSIIDDFTGM